MDQDKPQPFALASGQFINDVSDNLSKQEIRIILVLLEHYNHKTKQCNPTMGRIAKCMKLSDRQCSRLIASVEAKGLIHVYRTLGNSNSYEILCTVWGTLPGKRPRYTKPRTT